MTVGQNHINFSRKGPVRFDVIKHNGREYILRLSDVVDAGRIVRLGPISIEHGDEQMEVAFYEDVSAATAPREKRHSGSASWGVYVR